MTKPLKPKALFNAEVRRHGENQEIRKSETKRALINQYQCPQTKSLTTEVTEFSEKTKNSDFLCALCDSSERSERVVNLIQAVAIHSISMW